MRNNKWLLVAMLALGTACSSSGSSDGGAADDATAGDIDAVTINSSESTGDFTPALSLSTDDDGSLLFTLAAADLDGDGTVGTPSITAVTVTTGAPAGLVKGAVTDLALDCSAGDVSTGSGVVDVMVSLDTTGSMGAAAGVFADSIASFATSLEDAGLDVQFAGVTVGDAFDTKDVDSSLYDDAISEGTFGEPPAFDFDERPSSGVNLLDAGDMSTFFTEVGDVSGSGVGGGDGTENYLGSIQWLNEQVLNREGAQKLIISIGDNCAHTPDTQDEAGIEDPYSPPEPDTLIADLAGAGAVVHVVGNTDDTLFCDAGGYYNTQDLAAATGGTFTDLGGVGVCTDAATCTAADLSTLPIGDAITEATVSDCVATCDDGFTTTDSYTIVVESEIVDGAETGTAETTLDVTLDAGC